MDDRQRYEDTAQALTGRPVLLRFRNPPSRGAVGECYRPADAPGLIMIDLAPHLTGEERLKVFLHEVGHALAGHVNQVTPTAPEQERSGAVAIMATYAHPAAATVRNRREQEADTLRDLLYTFAIESVKNQSSPGDPWALRERLVLEALKFWRRSL